VLGGLDSDGAPLKDVFAFDSRPRRERRRGIY
jgi:hypothetical protein